MKKSGRAEAASVRVVLRAVSMKARRCGPRETSGGIERVMTSTYSYRTFLAAGAFAVAMMPVFAQDSGDGGTDDARKLPESFSEPIPLYPAVLGDHEHPISSTNAGAQAYFNQGFQLMYAFAKEDAVRSFRESWKRDPECAICYWGEAWAWGSYLNGPMRPFEAPHAYAAMQEAVSRID